MLNHSNAAHSVICDEIAAQGFTEYYTPFMTGNPVWTLYYGDGISTTLQWNDVLRHWAMAFRRPRKLPERATMTSAKLSEWLNG